MHVMYHRKQLLFVPCAREGCYPSCHVLERVAIIYVRAVCMLRGESNRSDESEMYSAFGFLVAGQCRESLHRTHAGCGIHCIHGKSLTTGYS